MIEYRTLEYENTPVGQRQKINDLEVLAQSGWTVVSETLTPGVSKGACIAPGCCFPMIIPGQTTPGTITVTLQRDTDADPETIDPQAAPSHPALDAQRQQIDSLIKRTQALHTVLLQTPRADTPIEVTPLQLPPMPEKPTPKDPGILGWIWSGHRKRVEKLNDDVYREYETACAGWERNRAEAQAKHDAWRHDLEVGRLSDPEVMNRVMNYQLGQLPWLGVQDFALSTDGQQMTMGMILPKFEDAPKMWPEKDKNRWTIRPLTEVEQRGVYAKFIHRLGLRAAGEAFRALPSLQQLTLSAFAERRDLATGSLRRECLFSVEIPRSKWLEINFEELEKVEPFACLDRFGPRKSMSSDYQFSAVTPIGQSE